MRVGLILLVTCLTAPSMSSGEGGIPALPTGRTFHRAVTIGDQVFVVGGFDAASGEVSQQLSILDIKTRRWTQRLLPFSSSAITLAACIRDELYLVDIDAPALRRYHPGDDAWTELDAPSVARPHSALVAHKGKLVLLGGYSDGITEKNCVEIYDPAADSWSIGPPMPGFKKGDHFHLAAVINEELHVVGHYFGGQSHRVFDGDGWKTLPDSPFDAGWKSAVLQAVDDRLFLFEVIHSDPKAEKGSIHRYDPSIARWRQIDSTPEGFPLMLAAGASIGDRILILGGSPDPSAVFVYDVTSKQWQTSKHEVPAQLESDSSKPARESPSDRKGGVEVHGEPDGPAHAARANPAD